MTDPVTFAAAGAAAATAPGARAEPDLRNLWYYALPSKALAARRLVAKTLLGEDVVFGRDAAGDPFCLVDLCPHRGIPLRFGRFDGREVECCYHGWRFAPDGALCAIPSLVDGQGFDFARVRVKGYPCREANGNIWVFMGEGTPPFAPSRDIPALPDVGLGAPAIHECQLFPCPMDHAVMGLMDPAHGPFVHGVWWWRPRHTAQEKAKAYGPSELGFTMLRHRPSSNSRAYRILGGAPETEISYQLPGTRIEHVRAGRHHVVSLTCVTPVNARETEVNQMVYWTNPVLGLFRPVLKQFARAFLGQDRDIVTKQQLGLAHHPPLRLIDDADTPAKWYLKLKREWRRAEAEGRAFENPVPECVLRWRS
jgi:phenylpropionate dioxygenase-like ring-hydroxylating dioxygenase large terminal subunit